MKNLRFKFFTFAIVILHFLPTNSSAQVSTNESSLECMNNFYKYTSVDLNTESALSCLVKISTDKLAATRLTGMIHDEFVQGVVDRPLPANVDTAKIHTARRVQAFGKQLMVRIMADTNKTIKHIVNPLYLFSSISDNANDEAKLSSLTGRFIQEELSDPDIYSNRAGRYALMIYPVINAKPGLKPLAGKLLAKVNAYLENGQVSTSEKSTQDELGRRAWYRYLYAYVNTIKSGQEIDLSKRKSYLKTAYDYSPDPIDRQHEWGFFYDMHLIFGTEKASFRDEYLQFLTENITDQKSILPTLLEIALQQPEYKQQLKTAYLKINGEQADFPKFWMASVNSYAQNAHPISLSMLDKSRFSNQNSNGKWLLVDFWGTWCGPCRSEHPDMQKFYDSTIKTNADKIMLLTIACRDTEAKVAGYMNEKKFSFPVAMSDNKVEHIYKIPGYPTKLLITPAGKYVMVPANYDWANFVKHYVDL